MRQEAENQPSTSYQDQFLKLSFPGRVLEILVGVLYAKRLRCVFPRVLFLIIISLQHTHLFVKHKGNIKHFSFAANASFVSRGRRRNIAGERSGSHCSHCHITVT